MTKEAITNLFKKILSEYDSAPLYSYLGGSFNTPFFNESSDLDVMLIWPNIPSKEERILIVDHISKAFEMEKEWAFFDDEDQVVRDAVKLQGYRKIEIYHHDFISFEKTLNSQSFENGLAFSLANRKSLQNECEIDWFIDSFLPSSKQVEVEASNLYFSIKADLSQKTEIRMTGLNYAKLYCLTVYGLIPAGKHLAKIEKQVLNQEDVIIQAAAKFGFKPNSRFTISPSIEIKKYDPTLNEHVFNMIQTQRERLNQFLSWPEKIKSLDDQNEFSLRAERQWLSDSAYHLQIFSDSQFSGAISIHSLNFAKRSFEFGYWIDERREGKGLVGQSLSVLIHEMNLKGWKKAIITCRSDNQRSQSMAIRMGMTLESTTERTGNTYLSFSKVLV